MSRASGLPTIVTDAAPEGGVERAFAAQLQGLRATPPLALAVSGGGDSAAMLHLVADWARDAGHDLPSISVLTVDHGLRASSCAEAEQVGLWAGALGFTPHILTWGGDKPDAGLQAAARAARRDLLCRWCRDHDVAQLLMAHTADDQVETVGMRLMRGSGTAGLGGMAAAADAPFGVCILRPLLGVTRADLRNWLRARDLPWIDDPSNDNAAFERIRMRQALESDGATGARIAALALEAGAARTALDHAADALLLGAVMLHPAGWARADLRTFAAAPRSVADHALARLLRGLGGRAHPPHRDSLARLWGALGGNEFTGATLAGCRIVPEGPNSALFGRETRNLSPLALTARQWSLWDHRFEIWSPAPARVLPLAAVGLDAFPGEARERVKTAAPPPFRGALPVVEDAEGRLVLPHGGIGVGTGREEELQVIFSAVRPFGPLAPDGAPPEVAKRT